jgi:hypothetical protein
VTATLNMNNQHAAREAPKPASWFDTLLRYATIAMVSYMFVRPNMTPQQPREPSAGSKDPNTPNTDIFKDPRVISFERAKLITSERIAENEQRLKQAKELMKTFGFQQNETSSYVLPTFPTHTDDGVSLGSHRSILKAKAIPPVLDLAVFISDEKAFEIQETSSPVWLLKDIHLSWDQNATIIKHAMNVSIPLLYRNDAIIDPSANIYTHVLLLSASDTARSLFPSYPLNPALSIVATRSYEMIKYKTVKIKPKLRNLLNESMSLPSTSGTTAGEPEEVKNENKTITKAFWKPTVDLSFVLDIPESPRNQLPSDIAKRLNISDEGYIFPELYRNEFWITSKHLVEMNATTG